MSTLLIRTDNHGRRVVERGGVTFYMTADGRVMRQWLETTRDRHGKEWKTPRYKVTRSRFADRVREALIADRQQTGGQS